MQAERAVRRRGKGLAGEAPAQEESGGADRTGGGERARWLRGAAFGIAGLCLLPMVMVLLAALSGWTDTLAHLWATVLADYIGNTLVLVLLVASGTLLIGVSAAWLVTACEFPGRRLLQAALVLPLAFPAYVLAYAYTHVFDHPGFVQSALRAAFDLGPRDYWFPEIRSVGGAALMLSLVLYPYVYLLARAAFLQQGLRGLETARQLGQSPLGAFLRVCLPMARPAIAGGVLLAVMETIADFGTVAYFGVNTFATGIYASWFSMADRIAAAQLSLGLLSFALLLVALEHLTRKSGSAYVAMGYSSGAPPIRLSGGRAAAAMAACALPVLFGFAGPTLVLFAMALHSEQAVFTQRYWGFFVNSVTLALVAAVVTVAAAAVVAYFRRVSPGRAATGAGAIVRLGYAVPGGVIAVGLLTPFAAIDNTLDAWMRETFGLSTGLLFTGSIFLLVMAYAIRFLAAAMNTYDSGQGTISPSIDAAARTLGQSPAGVWWRVHMPMLVPTLLTALLIVFVDVMKELPATLIMRPFNWDTLAVQAFRLASDERLRGAAVPSLAIVAVGLLPVILICRRLNKGR